MSSAWDRTAARANAAQLRTFGESVTHRRAADGVEATLTMIPGQPASPENEPAYIALEGLASVFAVAPAPGDAFVVRGTEYRAYDVLQDLEGWIKVRLRA